MSEKLLFYGLPTELSEEQLEKQLKTDLYVRKHAMALSVSKPFASCRT